ncbi:RNA-binding protein 26 [Achaetomium macrosporum]|uniref:RNA-binding protein 26 n=1 Tax=Achaetomium macrosporum TaxID=79813 RepID=A0AAN7C5S4_9PEZI|nr:RNA-binding protein 26 [Achaetomium macrosporum]
MLFSEEDSPHLKRWIVKRLENISDADADVLADYVLALLRHDGDVNDVRKLCEEEIPDFLKEDSSVFVNDVFEALAYRSYLPGAPPLPPKHAPLSAAAGVQQHPGLPYNVTPSDSAPTYQPPFRNGRKRAYVDWDDPNTQGGRDAGYGGMGFKHPRRGGFGGPGPRQDGVNSFGGSAPTISPYPPPGQLPPQSAPVPSTVGYLDPKGAMDALYGMSMAAGHPMPELLSHDRDQPPTRRRKKCRDWEKKGYCQRGSNCMFEHSTDTFYPPLFAGSPYGSVQPVPQPPAVEEYDPTNALMPDLLDRPVPLQGQQPLPEFGQHPRQKGGKHHNRQRRAERAPFSAEGPVYDRTKSTIVVENIPEENFSEDQVRAFFSQFGMILEVSMQPYKRLAIVKFDSWDSANAAYQSPKVIFDNRFVKVFWHKGDNSTQPVSGSASGTKRTQSANGSSTSPGAEIDLEEFAKKQEEKQKAFEEKTKKRQELERRRQELEQRQKELMAKQLEEKAKLAAKLAQRNGTKSGDKDGESEPSKPMTQTEALRAQLAALEAEAREMGLDPDAIDGPPSWSPGYGRGRGGWRGPSRYMPRGSYRGGYRGRANVHAAYAAYSLDNRPKKVVLTGVDFTVSEKDETLRQYLFGIGEFTDIHTTPTSTEITFKDRKTAEKFFNSILLHNKEIPGIEGCPVELAWGGTNGSSGSVPTTPGGGSASFSTPTAAAGKSSTNTITDGVTTAISGGGTGTKRETANTTTDDTAGSSSDKDVHIQLERPPQDQNEMDYEVADEGSWGY